MADDDEQPWSRWIWSDIRNDYHSHRILSNGTTEYRWASTSDVDAKPTRRALEQEPNQHWDPRNSVERRPLEQSSLQQRHPPTEYPSERRAMENALCLNGEITTRLDRRAIQYMSTIKIQKAKPQNMANVAPFSSEDHPVGSRATQGSTLQEDQCRIMEYAASQPQGLISPESRDQRRHLEQGVVQELPIVNLRRRQMEYAAAQQQQEAALQKYWRLRRALEQRFSQQDPAHYPSRRPMEYAAAMNQMPLASSSIEYERMQRAMETRIFQQHQRRQMEYAASQPQYAAPAAGYGGGRRTMETGYGQHAGYGGHSQQTWYSPSPYINRYVAPVEISYQDHTANDGSHTSPTHATYDLRDEAIPSFIPPYTYQQLEEVDCIRLLEIEPGSLSIPLRCRLYVAKLDSQPFEALSYHWGAYAKGKGEDSCEVICDGQRIVVSENLFEALKAHRHASEPRVVWADAICINQNDIQERNHQVRLMRKIYTQATSVIVWIGNSQDPQVISNALSLACKIANIYPPTVRMSNEQANFQFYGKQQSIESANDAVLPTLASAEWRGLAQLFDEQWFWRVWVIQEVVLASKVIMRWGPAMIDFNWVGLAAAWVRTNEREFLTKWPRSGVWNAYLMYRLRTSDWNLSFIQILQHTRQFEVSDARDRIFGLLGLPAADCRPESGRLYVEPNYNLTYAQVFTEVATRAICDQYYIDILSSVQHVKNITFAMPSWVPDWNISTVHTLAPPRPKYGHSTSIGTVASLCLRGKAPSPDASYLSRGWPAELDVLCIEGIQAGSVEMCLLPFFAYMSDLSIPILNGLNHLLTVFRDDFTPQAVAWTLTAGKNWYGSLLTSDEEGNHLAEYHSLARDALDGMGSKKMDSILNGRGPRNSSVEWLADRRNTEEILYNESLPQSSPDSANRFLEAANRACISRRLFTTKSGSLGLGPPVMEPGDVICVLFGGSMPYILREAGDGRYHFVGECYIYDIMKGQAIEKWREGGTPSTFFNIF